MHPPLEVTGWSRFWLARLAVVRSLANFWNSLALTLAWPYVELLIRLWIAKLFFFFGVQQLMHWTAVMQMVDENNPFPLLAPAVSGYLSSGHGRRWYATGGLVVSVDSFPAVGPAPLKVRFRVDARISDLMGGADPKISLGALQRIIKAANRDIT